MGEFWAKSGTGLFVPPGNFKDYLSILANSGIELDKVKVLDAGCNRAWFAHFAVDYSGFDQNKEAVKNAREFWRGKRGWSKEDTERRIRVGTIEAAPFENETFDLVFAKDVLEHSRDPLTALSEFERLLKKDGCLFLSTPDIQKWVWHDPTHVRPYSRRSHRMIAEIQRWKILNEAYESVMPGTQKIARLFGNRSPLPLRALAGLSFWKRNVITVFMKGPFDEKSH